MIRALLRTVIILIILVAGAAFFLGYRWGDGIGPGAAREPAPTTGSRTGLPDSVDRDRAREAGAAIGEKVAVGASKAEQVIADSTLTAKIKSKITLDDTLRGTRINVDSRGTAVTLRGSVATTAQRSRAAQLARETSGVTSVDDRLEVVGR